MSAATQIQWKSIELSSSVMCYSSEITSETSENSNTSYPQTSMPIEWLSLLQTLWNLFPFFFLYFRLAEHRVETRQGWSCWQSTSATFLWWRVDSSPQTARPASSSHGTHSNNYLILCSMENRPQQKKTAGEITAVIKQDQEKTYMIKKAVLLVILQTMTPYTRYYKNFKPQSCFVMF